jgi:sec-independent protein translocase protein TatB
VFDLTPEKVILLGIIALVVLGPSKLPQAARNLGHFVAQMRKMTSSFQSEVRDALGEPIEAFNSVVGEVNPRSVPQALRRALDPTRPPTSTAPSAQTVEPAPPVTGAAVGSFGEVGQVLPPDDPSLN